MFWAITINSSALRESEAPKASLTLQISIPVAPGIYLCGIDDHWAGKPGAEKALIGTGAAQKLVFSHNPRIFPAINKSHCVAVCGHTHGGQINIPFVPNPCLMSWKKYVKGCFNEGNSQLYVNRGIGMLTLPFRFRCRPEITVFTVTAGR